MGFLLPKRKGYFTHNFKKGVSEEHDSAKIMTE